ncbi:MAG TPA: hypothetical protein VF054_21120 [Micromonosporaceae bacterium]
MTGRHKVQSRLGEVATSVVSDVAGTVVDPRTGFKHLRSRIRIGPLVMLGLAMVAGYALRRAIARR